ncbi:MAG: hypothetical protein QNJ81_07200 [Acidimicrobiia bacterium]|nr:hypothetical protein [Acidimicrobiia bacterium]
MEALELLHDEESEEVMESRLKVLETRCKEHAEKISDQQQQLHSHSVQLARMQALQEALREQEDKNFEANNEQHKQLSGKLDDLITAVAEKRGLVRGFIAKLFGISAVVFIIAAMSYYFPTVRAMIRALFEILQGPHP